MTEQRFPYEHSLWCSDAAQARRWYEVLERQGPENVRARLAQIDAGSRASVSIGEVSMTKGFAEEWLAWHDRQKMEGEDRFRRAQVRWLRWGVVVTAIIAVVGWLIAWLK